MTDTGGPAFPLIFDDDTKGTREIYSGMTLRDYFAAKAMQGLLAGCDPDQEVETSTCARWCYRMADAMLKAREQ